MNTVTAFLKSDMMQYLFCFLNLDLKVIFNPFKPSNSIFWFFLQGFFPAVYSELVSHAVKR